MEFRDFAARETLGLVSRLLASRSDATLQQLRALRDAFDAAAREAEAAAGVQPSIEADLQDLVRRLNQAATSAARAAAQRIQDEATATVAAVRAELDQERARVEELSALLAEAQAQLDAARHDFRHEAQRASDAEQDLAAARALNDEIDTARIAAEAEAQEQVRARQAAEQDLRETRDLLDTTLAEAASLHAQLDIEIGEKNGLHDELIAARAAREQLEAAAEERERAATALRDELQSVKRSLEDAIGEAARLSVQADDATAERAAMSVDLEAARAAQSRLESQLAEADAQAREVSHARAAAEHELLLIRRSLEDAISDVARMTVQLEEAAAEKGTLLADLGAARGELDELRAAFAGVEAERDFNRATVEGLERTRTEQAETIHTLENRLDAAISAEESVRARVAGSEEAIAGGQAEIDQLRAEVGRLRSLLDGSVRAADELAAAGSIGQLLVDLVRQLSSVYSRVALFRLKGNRLEGESQVGFDLNTDVKKLVIPVSVDSLIARAAISGAVESLTGSELDDSRHAPFGTSASAALAIPIVVRDDTLAVVYAEEPADSRSGAPDRQSIEQHATYAKLLVRHTVALLMRLTQELKTLAELGEYAAMLLQEAEQMHEADRQAGKSDEEVLQRLRDSIDCARQLYAQRAALEGPAAAALFDDHVLGTIEVHAGTPFARDLAAAVGQIGGGQRAAEAS